MPTGQAEKQRPLTTIRLRPFRTLQGLSTFEKPRQCWHRSSLLSYYSPSFSIFVLLTLSSLVVLRPSLCLHQFTKTNSSWCKILIGNKSDSDLCAQYLTASPITHFMASPQLPLPRVLSTSTKLPFHWFGCCHRRGPLRTILFCLPFTEPGLSMKTKKDHKEIYIGFGFRKVPHMTSPSKFFCSVNSGCCTFPPLVSCCYIWTRWILSIWTSLLISGCCSHLFRPHYLFVNEWCIHVHLRPQPLWCQTPYSDISIT